MGRDTKEAVMEERPAGEARTIVVGYDGSPVARAALGYAAQRAGAGGTLIVTYAFSPPPEWIGSPYWDDAINLHRDHGQRLMEELPQDLVGHARVERELLRDHPAEALAKVAESRDAEEIVVGSRGFGPFRATLGSVAHALLHHASRPVVVIPARMLGAEARGRAPHRIVVGYDGSATARDALGHAAYRAGPDGEVIAVYALRPPLEYYDTPLVTPALERNQEAARAALEGIAEDMVGGLPVRKVTLEGPVAPALVNVAQTEQADEIVVGSRGLGRFRAALGSVSHAVLHEADRPVVVVPHEPTAEEAEMAERVRRARNIRVGHTRI
jgi:nucleotide-binding universal stress UspA family protein